MPGASRSANGEAGARRVGYHVPFTFRLFENAYLSTVLHESGHLFFQVMQRLARRPEASDRLEADPELSIVSLSRQNSGLRLVDPKL